MDPFSSAILGKVLGLGFDNYLQPLIKEASTTLDKLVTLVQQESERQRLSLLSRAIFHLALRYESGNHFEKAQDLLIQATSLDPYSCVPLLLDGILLCEKSSSSRIGESYIDRALRLNPLALLQLGSNYGASIIADSKDSRLLLEGAARPEEYAESWKVDLINLKLPSVHNKMVIPSITRHVQRQFTALFGKSVFNFQAMVVAATVSGQSIFASWKISDNLRHQGEYVLGRLEHGKPVWVLRNINETPLFAGAKFLLLSEGGTDYMCGRNVNDGSVLFKASRAYVEAMIAPGLRYDAAAQFGYSLNMSSRDANEIVLSMSRREDDEGLPVAEPGYDHLVASERLIEKYLLNPIEGSVFSITNILDHWHPTMGNQFGSCILSGSGLVAGLARPANHGVASPQSY